MVSLLNFVTLAVLLVHAGLLAYVVVRKRLKRVELQWLAAVIVVSAVAVATFLIPPDALLAEKFGRGFVLVLALIGLLGTFGSLMIEDMTRGTHHKRLLTGWWAFIGGWLVLLVLAAVLSPTLVIGQPDWLLQALPAPDLPTLITLPGLALAAMALPALGFYLFYQALLPEVANRALYWVLECALLLTAVVLLGSGNSTLAALGMIALVTVLIGATTAFARHRVFDIRSGLNQSIVIVLLMGFTAVILFGILYTVTGLDLHRRPNGLSLLVGLSVVTALILIPIRQLLEAVFRRLISQPKIEPTAAMRGYSQQVAQAVELDELAQAASLTLNRVMGIRRSGLMLVNGTFNQELELLMIPGGSFGPETKGRTLNIPLNSNLFRTLARDHRAVSQFDLDFDPRYRDMSEKNRAFFARLQMSAYAPIIMDNVLMGVLVCGPRQNDVAYFPPDLDLLTTLAHQTGFALRNARLVADLQHLNATMRSLNGGLEGANRELARLDSVKTDFVTIASHELRTPLAQIRGYTDIIDTINDQGMLDQDQTTVLVSNLRKATERMEELISAMLDVSQLDVNAMDLRFTQTATDTILRLAIEPLTDAIKQRKQSLMMRGVKGLPPVQADLQRLVQAFRNVIVNAIKFTPDSGRIEIAASLQPAQTKDGIDHILVTIMDTGVGIDPSHLDLIFKKFYRTFDPQLHSTGTYKFLGAGPGLGLTIAKGVIESHGGRIWAESEGHNLDTLPGSTFYVLLPTIPPQSARKAVSFETNSNKLSLEKMVK